MQEPKLYDTIRVMRNEDMNKKVNLKFRGSTNQRKIDVKRSLKENRMIQLKFGDEEKYK